MGLSLAKHVPIVQIEGEIVTQPARTTVTRVFYRRVAIKLTPFFAFALFLVHDCVSLISGVLTLIIMFFIVTIFMPQLSGLGAIGGGLFRDFGNLLSAGSDLLDGVVGPNKGQVPVVILNVQTNSTPTPKSNDLAMIHCLNRLCQYENPAGSQHCLSCGTALNSSTLEASGPRRFSVRIEGQIVGGEPTVGHRVSIDAFDNRGNLLFISGRDETTGADIIVKRNADTGKQH